MREKYPVRQLLKVLHLKRATYYDRLKRNEKPDKYAQLKAEIKKIFVQSKQTYGYRRIQLCTERDGFKASPDTILRLMNEIGIRPN
ncbi:IS3 family transposase, partial [Levilactobacillus fujinensis]